MLTTYISEKVSRTHVGTGEDEAAWPAFLVAPLAYNRCGLARENDEQATGEEVLKVECGGSGMQVTRRGPLVVLINKTNKVGLR
jgi:hypothetical protein